MKKLVIFSFALLASVNSVFANTVKIGDLYYDLVQYSSIAKVVSGYYGDISTINIPPTVTYENVTYTVQSIEEYAFYNFDNIISVIIPNSVTSIGTEAFSFCSGLTTINIPSSVTKIGLSPFYGCSSLPVVGNLRYADTYLVEAIDKNLSTYSIQDGTVWIGEDAFSDCGSLTSIIIPNGVSDIGKEAFSKCKALNTISIPNSVKSIGAMAFNECSNLVIDTIPEGVVEIGEKAFCGCKNITSIFIPSTVSRIGEKMFDGCKNLTKVTLNSNTIAAFTYSAQRNIYHIFGSQVKEYIIGNDVTKIGAYAFSYSNISSVKIGNNVDSICNDAFNQSGLDSVDLGEHVSYIGDRAFTFCNLTSIIIPASVKSMQSNSFSGCSLTSVTINSEAVVGENRVMKESMQYIFNWAHEYIIGDSVKSIGSGTFYQGGLRSISIGKNVKKIGQMAFTWNYHLQEITLPNSVLEIGASAFTGCSGLTKVNLSNNLEKIDDGAFSECTALTSISIPASVTNIESWAFGGCTGLQSVTCLATTPPTMGRNEIGNGVFEGLDCSTIPLHVPTESIDLYKAADQWKEFFGSGPGESIDEIRNIESHEQKFMRNGHIYILRGEHVYDAQGKMVR